MENKYNHYQHCWNYFALHATQRMNAFNYFILMQSAIFAGIFLLYQNKSPDIFLINLTTFIVLVVSIVFWQIDLRTRSLIKAAEEEIKKIENMNCENSQIGPFETNGIKQRYSIMRYSHSISSIYIIYALASIILLLKNVGALNIIKSHICQIQ